MHVEWSLKRDNVLRKQRMVWSRTVSEELKEINKVTKWSEVKRSSNRQSE